MPNFITQEAIENKIFVIRGQKVMIDRDLAMLYGVKTKYLNSQVKRNSRRFPEEFIFRLTQKEKDGVVAICNHLLPLKFSAYMPYAFTEHGVAMLASVLNSERAVKISISIIKTFVKLRQVILAHKELACKLGELERKIEKHDGEIQLIFEAIRKLMEPPPEKPKPRIGFHPQ